MVKNCKHCGKDISDLKPTQKGQHISNCRLNPNLKKIKEKLIEGGLVQCGVSQKRTINWK